jgi:hypothetical protein
MDIVNSYFLNSILHFGICEGAVKVYCFLNPRIPRNPSSSSCDYGNQDTVQFPEGIITNCHGEEMEIISPDNMDSECSYVVDQHSGGNHGNGIVQKSAYADQETETYVHQHMESSCVLWIRTLIS